MPKARRTVRRKSEAGDEQAQVVSLLRAVTARDGFCADDSPIEPGMRVGRLAHIGADGHLWVELRPAQRPPYSLRTIATVSLSRRDLGAEVVLWESADGLGVVLGRRVAPSAENQASGGTVEARLDGRRVVLEAADEIELRCGKASLILRRNGRVQLKGAYVETSAEGVNRIKGGSVQIN